jgi:hypothetical protein
MSSVLDYYHQLAFPSLYLQSTSTLGQPNPSKGKLKRKTSDRAKAPAEPNPSLFGAISGYPVGSRDTPAPPWNHPRLTWRRVTGVAYGVPDLLGSRNAILRRGQPQATASACLRTWPVGVSASSVVETRESSGGGTPAAAELLLGLEEFWEGAGNVFGGDVRVLFVCVFLE